MRNGILAPSGRGLRPQAVGERALPLSEVSDDGKALSLSPLRGQLPPRGSLFYYLAPILQKDFANAMANPCIIWYYNKLKTCSVSVYNC